MPANAPPLAGAFAAAWNRYRLDVLAALILFAAAALAAGRVWRFPFDDEIFTMAPNVPAQFRASGWNLARFYLEGGDLHPPLTFLFFSSLYKLGVGEAAMHCCSIAMTALALALWQLLALALITERGAAPICAVGRLITILLFGLSPFAIGLGDAIRWHPQFALCVALFICLYLAADRSTARLASAIPLGLAMSINLIAPLVILPFAIYRYLLEREWRASFDITFWLLFALFALPGFYTAASVVPELFAGSWSDTFGHSPFGAVAVDIFGLIGGNAVGLGEAWLISPAVAIAALAVGRQIEWRRPANPTHLLLLMLGAMVPAALVGFAEARAFFYLAPVLAVVLSIFLAGSGASSRTLLLAVCALLPGLVAIGELRGGTHPFKRNAAIPFGEIIDFITGNENGDSLIVSTDPVVPWELRKRADLHLCVSYFFQEEACLAQPQRYRSLFIVSGYSNHSRNDRAMQGFAARVAEITRGRDKIATIRVGRDEDAALKTRLTGVPLDEFILTVALYR